MVYWQLEEFHSIMHATIAKNIALREQSKLIIYNKTESLLPINELTRKKQKQLYDLQSDKHSKLSKIINIIVYNFDLSWLDKDEQQDNKKQHNMLRKKLREALVSFISIDNVNKLIIPVEIISLLKINNPKCYDQLMLSITKINKIEKDILCLTEKDISPVVPSQYYNLSELLEEYCNQYVHVKPATENAQEQMIKTITDSFKAAHGLKSNQGQILYVKKDSFNQYIQSLKSKQKKECRKINSFFYYSKQHVTNPQDIKHIKKHQV